MQAGPGRGGRHIAEVASRAGVSGGATGPRHVAHDGDRDARPADLLRERGLRRRDPPERGRRGRTGDLARRRPPLGGPSAHRDRTWHRPPRPGYIAGGDNATRPDAVAGDPDFWIYAVDGAWRATVWAAADAPGVPSLRRLPVAVVAQSDLGALRRATTWRRRHPPGSMPSTRPSPSPRSRGEGQHSGRRPQRPARAGGPADGRRRDVSAVARRGAEPGPRERSGLSKAVGARGSPRRSECGW